MIKKILFSNTFFLHFVYSIIIAQPFSVSNVEFKIENEQISISYDLLGEKDNLYKIGLKLLRKSDPTFILIPQKVIGDIGEKIKPGLGKIITWNISKEIKGKLKGLDFYFQVEAFYKEKNNYWYWFGGLLASGLATATYFLTSSNSVEKITIANPPERP